MDYVAKAKDSFRTKINLFIYEWVTHDRSKFSLQDFKGYSIGPEIVKEYTKVYWQETTDFKIRNKSIKQIEKLVSDTKEENKIVIKQCEEFYIKEIFPEIFPRSDFDIITKADKCIYCGVTKDEIVKLANLRQLNKKNLRGWNLEIDRLNSNYEYTPQNCEMCCYWCNNAKTDEFTPEEFKYIGQIIGTIWSKRLRTERFTSDGSEISIARQNDN